MSNFIPSMLPCNRLSPRECVTFQVFLTSWGPSAPAQMSKHILYWVLCNSYKIILSWWLLASTPGNITSQRKVLCSIRSCHHEPDVCILSSCLHDHLVFIQAGFCCSLETDEERWNWCIWKKNMHKNSENVCTSKYNARWRKQNSSHRFSEI